MYGYREMYNEVKTMGFSYGKWTCGANKSIVPGDRIFLIRLGEEPKGMIASGYAVSPVFEGTHWDPDKRVAGIEARRVYIRFDKILDVDTGILDINELKRIDGYMCWSSQSSGISIPDEVAACLELSWEKY
ncbi:MAG: hypothetical protein K5911_09050 [Eubacteriales bacterium]|nr:hypothetical protein [Eubacteriales bacterium]